MKTHSEIDAENHHERWNTTGYPHGCGGEDIPLASRIVVLADVYDETLEIIDAEKGKHFDPVIVGCFLRDAGEFGAVRAKMEKKEGSAGLPS